MPLWQSLSLSSETHTAWLVIALCAWNDVDGTFSSRVDGLRRFAKGGQNVDHSKRVRRYRFEERPYLSLN